MARAADELLFDRFRVGRLLGAGAHGEVVEAFDERLSACVALKRLTRAGPALSARFKQEFRALAGFAHVNLVALHELFGEGEHLAFSMELVEGVPFRSWVRREESAPQAPTLDAVATGPEGAPARAMTPADPTASTGARGEKEVAVAPPQGALDPSRLRAALAQLASAVLALHAAGKLHRDLKPGNVLVSSAGRVVVLDFGLAQPLEADRLAPEELPAAALQGTPLYMSPEQAAGAPASPASDWYAVGVMLYEALTGAPPFAGAAFDVLAQKQRFDAIDPRLRAHGLPRDLCELSLELLRRDPSARPSGGAIARRLGLEAEAPSLLRSRRAGAPLAGRAAELGQLTAALATARAGRTSLALLRGPAGIGKTALAHAFLDALEARGEALVLEGRAWARESVPGSALETLLEGLAGHLRRLPAHELAGVLPRDAPAAAALQGFAPLAHLPAIAAAAQGTPETPPPQAGLAESAAALRALLSGLAARVPLILFLDDAHFCDEASARVLRAVLGEPAAPMLLFIAALRSEVEEGALLARLLRGSSAERREIDVGPLPEPAMRALLEPLLPLGEAEGALAATLAREARGSPFLARLLARIVRRAVARGASFAAAAPVVLAAELSARVAKLPASEHLLLSLLVAADGPVPRAALHAASSLGAESERALGSLVAARFVKTLGVGAADVLDVFHDSIRESARRALDPAELARLRALLR